MATFTKGQRVTTPKGPGRVNYQRMGGPDYTNAVAVSVILDNRPADHDGTVFLAELVKPLKEG